jgi:hypothetical protein
MKSPKKPVLGKKLSMKMLTEYIVNQLGSCEAGTKYLTKFTTPREAWEGRNYGRMLWVFHEEYQDLYLSLCDRLSKKFPECNFGISTGDYTDANVASALRKMMPYARVEKMVLRAIYKYAMTEYKEALKLYRLSK